MVFINKISLIKKCNALSDYYLKIGIDFKQLALSIGQNKADVTLNKFINDRYNELIRIKEKDK